MNRSMNGCKLDIHTAILSTPPSESRITVFLGGNLKISNVLKISPCLREVPLGLRYQGISSYINLSVFFFIKVEWLGLGPKSIDESLPATAPSAHTGFSKGRLGPHVMIMIKDGPLFFIGGGGGTFLVKKCSQAVVG